MQNELLKKKLQKVWEELRVEKQVLVKCFMPTQEREYDRKSILEQHEEEKRLYKKYNKDCTNITDVLVELDGAMEDLFFIIKFN